MNKILDHIHNYWPNLVVTNEMLQNPTQTFVVQLYGLILATIEERCNTLAGWYDNPVKPELDPEEVIYLKMKKLEYLFECGNLTITLGDIYAPISSKTKQIITICMHFIIYIDNMHPNIEKETADILAIKEETSRLVNEEEQLVIEINETAMVKGQLLQDNDKLRKSIEKAKAKKDNYLAKLSTIQRDLQVQQKELDELTRNTEELKISIGKKEAIEKQLVEETITDEEYTGLIKFIKALETEKESLGNDDLELEQLLSKENDMLHHYSTCRKMIPDFFNIQLLQRVILNEEEIIDLEKEKNDYLSKLSMQKSIYIRKKKIFEEIKDAHIQSNLNFENIKKEIKEKRENVSQDVFKFNENMQISLKQHSNENQKIKSDILILKNNLEKVRDCFKTEYIKICKKECSTYNKIFKELEDYNNLLQ